MEGGEALHEPAQLEDDVLRDVAGNSNIDVIDFRSEEGPCRHLHVLVVEQLQLDHDVGSQLGEPQPGVGPAPQDEPAVEFGGGEILLQSVTCAFFMTLSIFLAF